MKGFLGLVSIAVFLVACGNGSSTPAAPDKGTVTASPSTSAPHIPIALLDVSGSGIKSTNKFTAGGDWDLNWSYDCSAVGFRGNFSVTIYGKDSNDYRGLAANELGDKGADVTHEHDAGTFYLSVSSECNWHVQVTG